MCEDAIQLEDMTSQNQQTKKSVKATEQQN